MRALTSLVVAVLLGIAAPASAQEASAEATSEARIAFAQGVEAFEAGRFDEALRHFLQAFQLRPHPTVRVNLASSYAKLRRAPAAVMHYRAYLADRSVQLSRAARRDIQSALRLLEPGVGALDLELSPSDAVVQVDAQEPEARDGARVYVTPGTHRIEASAAGRATQTRIVEVSGGSAQSVSIELAVDATTTPPPPPAPEPPARDDPPVPPPDAHPVFAGADPDPTVDETRSERPSRGGSGRTIARWSAFGLAGAATVGAVVLGLLALGAEADFDDNATRIETRDYASDGERAAIERQARDDASRASSFALVTDACIGVAAAAAVTGTVLLLTARASPSADEVRARLRVVAGATPTGATVLVTGGF
jgi:hypothetical protein